MLHDKFQERLDKFRSNVKVVKPAHKSPGNFVPRGKDYGDDLTEFEAKQSKNYHDQLDKYGVRR